MLKLLFTILLIITSAGFQHSIAETINTTDTNTFNIYDLKRGVVSISNNVLKRPYGYASMGFASGFIIDKELGIIITNSHVANNTSVNEIKVSFSNGQEVTAHCLYADPWHDFSFLKVNPEELPDNTEALSFATHDPKIETKIIMIGNNQNQNYSVQEGSINSLYDSIGFFPIQTMTISMNVRGGSSGSAVVNSKGEVMGIVFGSGDTFAYAIPVQYLRDAFEKLKFGMIPERHDIGAYIDFISLDKLVRSDNFPKKVADQYLKDHPSNMNFVLHVKRSMIETPASKFLKPGDVIWAINDIEVGANLYKAQKIMNDAKKDMKFSIYREGVKKEIFIPFYDLYQPIVKKMLIFGGAIFYEADDMSRMLDGVSIGDVMVKNMEQGSSFAIFPYNRFDEYGYVQAVKILSYKDKIIHNLNDLIDLLPTLIKSKYFTLNYQNLVPYQGYNNAPVLSKNIMKGIVEYNDYTEPMLLEYNNNTFKWEKKQLKLQ